MVKMMTWLYAVMYFIVSIGAKNIMNDILIFLFFTHDSFLFSATSIAGSQKDVKADEYTFVFSFVRLFPSFQSSKYQVSDIHDRQ